MTTKIANPQHVVVDGSNIATEGRSMPSLAQLNEAVNSYIADHPGVRVTVVVDATFGHRIASSEVKEFDAAIANNELVAPPAGAVGRGDAFVLSIAKKAKATILSNDSFQEFHGEHEWLFDEGRLVGGKPVPHVGWVWVARSPVRGPISRKAVRASKPPSVRNAAADGGSAKTDHEPATRRGSGRRASKEAAAPMPVPTTPPPGRAAPPRDGRAAPSAPSAPPGEVVNELMPFLDFVQHHPVGTSVNATVDSYSSHGAYVRIGDVFGYVPLRLMSDPPPRSAREVMKVGDAVTLVVASFAPARRSIDCAVPNMASVVEPQDGEAVAAEAAGAVPPSAKKAAARKTTAKKVAAAPAKKAAGSPAKKAAQPRAAKKAAPPSTKKAAAASKAPATDVLEPTTKEPAAKEPPAKKATTQPSTRKAASRSTNRPTPMPPDEVVSPEARARRRGPRSASAAAPGPSPEPDTPPVAAAAVAAAAPTSDAGPPQTSPPRRHSRAAKKVADA